MSCPVSETSSSVVLCFIIQGLWPLNLKSDISCRNRVAGSCLLVTRKHRREVKRAGYRAGGKDPGVWLVASSIRVVSRPSYCRSQGKISYPEHIQPSIDRTKQDRKREPGRLAWWSHSTELSDSAPSPTVNPGWSRHLVPVSHNWSPYRHK